MHWGGGRGFWMIQAQYIHSSPPPAVLPGSWQAPTGTGDPCHDVHSNETLVYVLDFKNISKSCVFIFYIFIFIMWYDFLLCSCYNFGIFRSISFLFYLCFESLFTSTLLWFYIDFMLLLFSPPSPPNKIIIQCLIWPRFLTFF